MSGSGKLFDIILKACIVRLFLDYRNFEHSEISFKDKTAIDATGMCIPARAHFRLFGPEVSLGCLHIYGVESVARSNEIGKFEGLESRSGQ